MAACLEPMSCHAYSSSMSHLALSPKNSQIVVYRCSTSQNSDSSPKWTQESVLEQHDKRVTGIDWAPKTDRIVTCSADRNAYVWTRSTDNSTGIDTWQPTLVLLRINRAATSVKWSPNEEKFAVATGAKLICVCHFDSANDWWVSKHIKKPIKSTVTCLDWHPNNLLLACGSTDYKARIFSTYIKEVDAKNTTTNLDSNPWIQSKRLLNQNSITENGTSTPNCPSIACAVEYLTTGALIGEFGNSGAWVHDVAFSGDGTILAWVSHDSTISVVNSLVGQSAILTLKTRYLPFLSCAWLNQIHLVASGQDCCPMLFKYDSANHLLEFITKLDHEHASSSHQEPSANSRFNAMRKFKQMDTRAAATGGNAVVSGDKTDDGCSNGPPQTDFACLNLKCSRTQATIKVLV